MIGMIGGNLRIWEFRDFFDQFSKDTMLHTMFFSWAGRSCFQGLYILWSCDFSIGICWLSILLILLILTGLWCLSILAIEKSWKIRAFHRTFGAFCEPEVCGGFEQDARPEEFPGGMALFLCHGATSWTLSYPLVKKHSYVELSCRGRSSRLIWARQNGPDESAAECANVRSHCAWNRLPVGTWNSGLLWPVDACVMHDVH